MRRLISGLALTVGVLGWTTPAFAGDGDVDNSWGGDGIVDITFPSIPDVWASAVAPHGSDRVVVVGDGDPGSGVNAPFLMRFLSNGNPDPSCNGNGFTAYGGPGDIVVSDLLVLPDGSTVLVGTEQGIPPRGVVMKFSPDCRADGSFGVGGIAMFSSDDGVTFTSTAAGPGGSIVVGGGTFFSAADGGDSRFTVYRLLSDGLPDPSFGTNQSGRWVSALEHEGTLADLHVDTLGRTTFTGRQYGSDFDEAVGRLTTGGSPDVDFGSGGWFVWSGTGDEWGRSIDRRPDGRYVIVGLDQTGVADSASLLCLTSSGTLDTLCPSGGRSIVSVTQGGDGWFWSVVIDDMGRLVLSGAASDPTVNYTDIAPFVMRLLADGTADPSFGTDGVVLLPRQNSQLFHVSRDQVGRILGTGIDYEPSGRLGIVTRLAASTTTTTTSTTTTIPTPTTTVPIVTVSTVSVSALPDTGTDSHQAWVFGILFIGVGVAAIGARNPRVRT